MKLNGREPGGKWEEWEITLVFKHETTSLPAGGAPNAS